MRKVVSGLFLAILIGAMTLGLVYQQRIIDQFTVWSYEPSFEIAHLANRTSLSDKGRFYFYVSKPELVGADQFNERCPRVERASPVLGCYNPATDRTHIYDIQDEQLDGIREVTSAHEMLHVVFDRLSQNEIDQLRGPLEAAYQRLKTPKLEERMDYYERNEPSSLINELHSIIPTEFSDIGPELEEYYDKFFSDRQKLVALYASYAQKFEDIEQEMSTLVQNLEARSREIANMRSSYEADIARANQQVTVFNQRAVSGGFSSRQEFDRERSRLVSQSSALNNRQNQLILAIDAYNRDVDRLNTLGVQMERLNKSIDSLEAVE